MTNAYFKLSSQVVFMGIFPIRLQLYIEIKLKHRDNDKIGKIS